MSKPKPDQEAKNNILYIRGDKDLKKALRRLLRKEQAKQPGVVLSMSSVCRRLLWEGIFRESRGPRFEIKQELDGTFDPDRVAEALVNEMLGPDLEKLS